MLTVVLLLRSHFRPKSFHQGHRPLLRLDFMYIFPSIHFQLQVKYYLFRIRSWNMFKSNHCNHLSSFKIFKKIFLLWIRFDPSWCHEYLGKKINSSTTLHSKSKIFNKIFHEITIRRNESIKNFEV